MLIPLSPVQLHIYKTIQSAYKKDKVVPTVRELMKILNYQSTGSVHNMLRVLQHKGYVKIIDYKARAYIPLVDL